MVNIIQIRVWLKAVIYHRRRLIQRFAFIEDPMLLDFARPIFPVVFGVFFNNLFLIIYCSYKSKMLQMVDAWGGWSLFQVLLRTLKKIASKHGVSIPTVAVKYILDQVNLSWTVISILYCLLICSGYNVISSVLDASLAWFLTFWLF